MAVSRLRFFPRQNLRFPSLFRLPSSSTHRWWPQNISRRFH
jgi:hypothetical protein